MDDPQEELASQPSDTSSPRTATRFLESLRHSCHSFLRGIGLTTVFSSSWDVKLILLQRFVRVFAYGLATLILAAYLKALGISETQIGVFFGLTLVGDLLMVMVLTQIADRVGRKAILVLGAGLMAMSGLVFAWSDQYWVLLVAAVFGVISPSATEVGPFKSIEESALFTLVTENLVDVLSWYSTAEFASVAVGLVASGGIMRYLQEARGWDFVSACRVVFLCYGAIGCLKVVLSCLMSEKIEHRRPAAVDGDEDDGERRSDEQGKAGVLDQEAAPLHPMESQPLLQGDIPKPTGLVKSKGKNGGNSIFALNREERAFLFKLCCLLGVDACAVGLSSVPWQTYLVRKRFDLADAELSLIFFMGNGFGALGTISSNWLARRFGNILTLVITLLPSAVILTFFGLPSKLWMMLILIVSESFLSPIYLAPRNTFMAAVLTVDKRTASLGVITMVKLTTNATGSFFTGFMADRDLFWLAFVVAGSLKVVYCFGMFFAFFALDRRTTLEREKMGDTIR